METREHEHFPVIGIGDFSDVVKPQPIRNFYLSHSIPGSSGPGKEEPFIFSGFCISLCMSGSCFLRISGRSFKAGPGSLLIISPDQLVEVVSVSPDFSPMSVMVSLDVILEFPSPVDINIMNAALKFPVLALPVQKMSCLAEYYDFLERRYSRTGNAYREEISKTIFYALMLEISDIFRSVSDDGGDIRKPKQEKLSDDFFILLSRHYRSEHNVGFYADRLNRTPKYLSTAIKRISGKSVADWISSSLISEIKLLLKVTDKTVLEISEDLNFSSPSVFVQFFRRHTGLTPLQYRKRQ